MFDRVLVPTDGSETAQSAVQSAIDLARIHDAVLHTVYVVDVGHPDFAPGKAEMWEPVVDAVRNQGNQHTGEVVEAATEAGLEAHQAVVDHGSPVEGVLGYADDHGIDLIVLGTHGRSGPKRWLLGSVAERIVRGSNVPVLVVPPGAVDE